MKKMIVMLGGLSLFVMTTTMAVADDPVDTVTKGCEKELKSYCSQVTPGEGRVLACIYAHNDKLSAQCEYALYDAAVQLQRAVKALVHVAKECQADIQKHCADIKPGEGRIAACLDKNASVLSKRCNTALKDVDARK